MAEDIAIVAFAQTPSYRRYNNSEPSMILGLVNQILKEIEVDRQQSRRTCPVCGARVSDEARTCPLCGVDLNLAAFEQAAEEAAAEAAAPEAAGAETAGAEAAETAAAGRPGPQKPGPQKLGAQRPRLQGTVPRPL